MKKLILAYSVVGTLGLGCGGDGRQVTDPDPVVARVDVLPGADTMTALAQTRTFTAVAKDAQGNVISGKSFSWSSSAAGVASVDPATGVVTAVANGDATIRAGVEGVTGQATLTVAQQVATVTVSPGTASLTVIGSTQQFTAEARDANANLVADVAFLWLSSNHNVAVVSPTGLATGAGPGAAAIVAAGRGIPGLATLSVQPTPALSFVLTVGRTGAGTVTSEPFGVYCGADCEHSYGNGTGVTLTATPDPGATFTGWGGACTGTGPCMVTMDAPKAVTAAFSAQTQRLTVTRSGPGTVASDPAGIYCGAACDARFPSGATVTLTPLPDPGFTFLEWSEACTGSEACTVVMNADRAVHATFGATLTVARSGDGSGAVTSDPTGISCGLACTMVATPGTTVTLTAAPDVGSVFGGWQGACTGTGPCVITLNAARVVTASFTLAARALTVTKSGSGTGRVTSAPGGIDCGADCTENYPVRTVVTLTATADAGSLFAGWTSGGCSGTNPCTVTMDAARSVNAVFGVPRTVSVSRAGAGTGSVVSAPGGIDCGVDCTEDFGEGTAVLLTATPMSGSTFDRWTAGPCLNSISASCGFTLVSAAVTATAAFEPPIALTVSTTNGRVTSTPAGIDCGTDCSEAYARGRSVSLFASPAAGYYFIGWSGACSGTGSCSLTMDADKAVTASFAPLMTLQITVAGGGFVFVSSPAGRFCSEDCAIQYVPGTVVTLSAGSGDPDVTFVRWSGLCAGATCTVTMDGPRSVTATFAWQLTLRRAGSGTGTISGDLKACDKFTSPSCTVPLPDGTKLILEGQPGAESAFDGWEGCDGVTGATCTLTLTAHRTVTAAFTLFHSLMVSKIGGGAGTVTSFGKGINCGTDCSEDYPDGTIVSLGAAPAAGSAFFGWAGSCSGVGVCTVTMDSKKSVSATFAVPYTLTVTKAGTGTGTVTSSPAGISCGLDCAQDYASGAVVDLTASPGSGWAFLGWSGACTGTGTCTLTMDAAKSVTATFGAGHTLTVAKAGTGTGFVLSSPAGIACGADCSQIYAPGSVVTLTADGSGFNAFLGWSGACTGTGTCTITMDAAKSVTATFGPGVNLTVNKTGTGFGIVTSSVGDVNCGNTSGGCVEAYAPGTVVTLTATPGTGSTFVGWSGACTGTGTCTVTMDANKSVTATFN